MTAVVFQMVAMDGRVKAARQLVMSGSRPWLYTLYGTAAANLPEYQSAGQVGAALYESSARPRGAAAVWLAVSSSPCRPAQEVSKSPAW